MELNTEQIKKALEHCIKDDTCEQCPYSPFTCHIQENALALIKQLTEDNVYGLSAKSPAEKCERLSVELEAMRTAANSYKMHNKKLTEENERLKKALYTDISIVRVSRGSGKTNHLREVARVRMDAVRADTVRKMQERLTLEFDRMHKSNFMTPEVRQWIIDQIAKEMLEGAE